MKSVLFPILLSMAVLAGCGDDNKPVSMADLPKENAIGFSVNTERFIETDKVLVDLAITKRGNDTTALTQQVNTTTAEVFQIVRANQAIESKNNAPTLQNLYFSLHTFVLCLLRLKLQLLLKVTAWL